MGSILLNYVNQLKQMCFANSYIFILFQYNKGKMHDSCAGAYRSYVTLNDLVTNLIKHLTG